MAIRTARAIWEGNLRRGKGAIRSESGILKGNYSYTSRFEDGKGTNPEELIGAGLAACYSMALAGLLEQKGFPPKRIDTLAHVELGQDDSGPKINWIELETEADIPRIEERQFLEFADIAKRNCPVSKALSATQIKLNARLIGAPVKVSVNA